MSSNLILLPDGPQTLSEWCALWWESYLPRLYSFYLFSEDYCQLWDKLWEDYDRLKAADVAVSRSNFLGLDELKEYRQTINDEKKKHYQPVKPEQRMYFPLFVQLDRHLDTQNQDRLHHWKATRENFQKFQRQYNASTESSIVSERGSQRYPFRKGLSQTQCASYEVLEQWWAAAYCHQGLLAAVRSFLNPVEPLKNECYLPESREVEKLVLLDQSYYHRVCFHLFLREFNPRKWEPFASSSLSLLNAARSFASWMATAQCLSYNMLSTPKPGHGRSYPSIVPLTDIQASNQGSEGSPRWLWDTHAQKTVIVAEFETCPAYVCISHTWGRWRRPTLVNLSGVDWLVPENELYDVRDLLQTLRKLPSRYLWLDLFCIPQDGSTAANEEIARQTAIFKGAEACFAWMYDVDSWEGMENALEWLCKQYLSMTEDYRCSETESEVLCGQHITPSSHFLGLIQRHSTNEQWEPSTWFSSLWTLQEAVLCPRLELWSKNWHRLEDTTGAAVCLVSLTVFLHLALESSHGADAIFNFDTNPRNPLNEHGAGSYFASNRRAGENAIPRVVRQLQKLLDLTHIDNVLLSSSPVSIIFNANFRRCTGSRAPAIMSAIGVTDWYFRQVRDGGNGARNGYEENLVLDTYPLDFVREAFRKTGARFFETSISNAKLRYERCLREKRPMGSMLQFASPKDWLDRPFGPPEIDRIDVTDHPTVSEWEICGDATVRMRSASIFDATTAIGDTKTHGSLLWLEEDTDIKHGETDDFHKKLQELAAGRNAYAVELFQDGFSRHGLLFCQRREEDCETCPSFLIKVGVFWTLMDSVNAPWSVVSSVDWIIL